ncbi:MAG: transaldolase family protein [Desulfovermiculus sp.]|nr:transaldolase family protein [Desulfovermiculus sp.]
MGSSIRILENSNCSAQVLAASLRNPRQVREAGLAGAHIATLPFSVMADLLTHEQTADGMRGFTSDLVPEYEQLYS